MANQKRRDVEALIDHPSNPVTNVQATDLEKQDEFPKSGQTYTEEEYLKIHDKLVAAGVLKRVIPDLFLKLFGKDAPNYDGGKRKGIYTMPKEDVLNGTTIALLGDWGTYTTDSINLAKQVSKLNPQYTIHLGDTYFTGSEDEIDQCYNPALKNWCYGSLGSFAMLGNHEMYSLAKAYYNHLLKKWMGTWQEGNQNDKIEKQEFSYFCLENEHWRIIGLDTGTDSYRDIPFEHGDLFSGNTQLDIKDEQLEWLKKEVFKNPDDTRGIIVLTHHQPWDSLKNYVYPVPATTLSANNLVGNKKHILWFCGHDHYFSMYGCSKGNTIVKAFVRCIGHAGMPVNLWDKKKGQMKSKGDKDANKQGNEYLAVYDLRERPNDTTNPDIHLGYNGFAGITLKQNVAVINYYQHDPKADVISSLITETWSVKNGDLSGTIVKNPAGAELTIEGGDINKAVNP